MGLKDTEEVFTAALLQDLAIPILAKEKPKEYQQLLEESLNQQIPLSLLEQKSLGWTHSEVGGMLLRKWHLPESMARLVEGHTSLEKWLDSPTLEGDGLSVALSALLPTVRSGQWHELTQLEESYEKLRGPKGPPLEQIFIQIDKDFADFAPILKITNPPKSLTLTYHEALASVR